MMNEERFARSPLAATPKRNALREVTNSVNVSPTANLKLLTKVALGNSYDRKEKSLQILCDRFLELFPLHDCSGTLEVHLDATARLLGVEKRRIYDIINILEALQCATHLRKNTYTWHGGARLEALLSSLKVQADTLGISHALHLKKSTPSGPKQKSLGILAQRFLMLFLVQPHGAFINLEMAVSVLVDGSPGNGISERQHKSKVRRLYDISNVLLSIGLIEKVIGSTVLKKPVFRYVGPKCIAIKQCTPPTSSVHLTPASLLPNEDRVFQLQPVKSKRKLIFSPEAGRMSPVDYRSTKMVCYTPPTTPSHKWDEILHVADIELHKLNNRSTF